MRKNNVNLIFELFIFKLTVIISKLMTRSKLKNKLKFFFFLDKGILFLQIYLYNTHHRRT